MRVNAFSASAAVLLVASGAFAASHRNGPLLLEDQTANLNDFYIFRSWEQGHTSSVVMSMSVQGFQNPDNGPSYYKFSNSVLYRFNVNNSRGLDGNPDMQIDFVFVDTIAPNAPFVSYLGQITSIDDPGIFLKETYVVVIRNLSNNTAQFFFNDVNGHVLSVAPPNTGPNGTPNYEQNLAQPSIFTLSNGGRGGDLDVVGFRFGEIRLDDEQSDALQRVLCHAHAVGPDFHHRSAFGEMGLVGKAANAQPLRRGVGAVEHGGGPRADPAVFVAEVPFQFVPSVAQAGGVAGEGEIDHVGAVAGIEFGAQSGGQQIVDSSLVGGAIAAGAE